MSRMSMIESAVILVGHEDSPSVAEFAAVFRRREVPFERAVGISDAVEKVVDWIAGENRRRAARGGAPIASVTTVDFVGHATQGKFFFGGEDGALTSCPDSYGRLDPLREL